jgi:putative membrane protein insertion efficiency factor
MRKVVIAALSFYKRFLSPFVPAACRFRPTCSEYMLEAVEKHGVGRGVWICSAVIPFVRAASIRFAKLHSHHGRFA